ncbi:LRR receptor-like serine/threonine-protein kinase RGI3 isoform X3 [Capsicum annuum]|uniref:LRR receptor-like serine/threonine-protein kinase RGI3 isoform X3 n=1 Tax=Capsicum annuum TaxID=4072 RepID=UPI001FB081A7|nr:LRR receptor-like serine/threonine-protein kinase RGI3 isoform X3 [Capsicum annuum]
MSTLETFNLNFNSIECQIPEVIGSLINLRELRLRGNKIIGSIPLSLSNASRLETLDISYSSLQGNIPEGIGNVHNMKLLGIQYNQLMGSIPFTIFNISRIEVIAFTGNSLSGYLPNGLCNGLPILKGLYLPDNKLHCHMPTSLSNCSQLQILSLSENEFDGPIHNEIGRLSNLQLLYVGVNYFTEYGQDGLVSTKCDVYSYGIMLLETFTRRKPNDFEGDVSLKQWVNHSFSRDNNGRSRCQLDNTNE